jgi:hypothetical protein
MVGLSWVRNDGKIYEYLDRLSNFRKLRGRSQQATYTVRGAAACRRS